MNRFVLFFALFSLFLPVSAGASDLCGRAKNSLDEVGCAQQKYDEISQQLNEIYDRVAQEQPSEEIGTALRQAQQQWVAFRDMECEWEASKVSETEALKRLNALACLIGSTQFRIERLHSYLAEGVETIQKNSFVVIESPRWLNVLSEDNPDVFWDYHGRLEVDMNCDGVAEHVLSGLKREDGVIPVLAVGENPVTGLPSSSLFKFGTCGDNASIEISEFDMANPGDGQCVKALKIKPGECDAKVLAWDGSVYGLRDVSLGSKPE